MPRTRPSLLLAALAVAALLAAGCGGGKATPTTTPAAPAAAKPKPPARPTEQAKRAVAAATAKTASASAHVAVHILLRKPGATNVLTYVATGDVVPDGGSLAIDLRQVGGKLSHEVFLRDGGDLVLYTSPSPMQLPQGKTWLRVDMTKYGRRRYGADTTFLAGADQDPLQAPKLLSSQAAKVRYLGRDQPPGRALYAHYRGTVDVVAAAKAAGVKGAGLAKFRSDVAEGTKTIDVWVNAQGQLAQVVVETPQKGPDGTTYQTRETTSFTRYGSKTTVRKPPAAKTEDYFTLFPK